MRRGGLFPAVLAVVAVSGALTLLWAQEKRDEPDALPPYVVETVPKSRAIDVEAKLGQIRVTYDRPMMDKTWSWIMHPDLGEYPGSRALGEPWWEDGGKTCVLPVALKPNTVYAIGCNSFRHTGFRDRSGRIAVPFVLVFKTKAAAP